ncbi:MAG: ATP-binding cassette domain-containing protein, partial [Alphaproteobacteria bacterium]|nr:ATP-binding cassette domain-containing protein [Alphaproteobacteria bacterium]
GASGIGKSTLLHLIAGFLNPLSGDILWQGQSICGLLPAERPVSILFQNDNLFPHLDVWTNIAIGLAANIRNSTDSRNMIEQSLSDLGIPGMNKRPIDTLSGGQQQRVALARALVRSRISLSDQSAKRSILLLDEPFSALDPETKAECLDQVKQMVARDGLTALMVTHDPADAKNLDAVVFSLKPNS